MRSRAVERYRPELAHAEVPVAPSPRPAARSRRRRSWEASCRSIDDPWYADEILIGLNFWTVEEFAAFAKVGVEQVRDWMAAGLPVLSLPDGSVRISEAAADEWAKHLARQSLVPTQPLVESNVGTQKRPQAGGIESPYLDAEQAAAYLGLPSVKALYGLRDRGRLKPLPGHRRLRFTKQQLDNYLEGRKK